MKRKNWRVTAAPGAAATPPAGSRSPFGASVSRADARNSRLHYFAASVALVVLTLLAFSNSFSTGFALDNQMLILGDSRIQSATAANAGLIIHHTYWWPNGEIG